jgi:hypothetical protein
MWHSLFIYLHHRHCHHHSYCLRALILAFIKLFILKWIFCFEIHISQKLYFHKFCPMFQTEISFMCSVTNRTISTGQASKAVIQGPMQWQRNMQQTYFLCTILNLRVARLYILFIPVSNSVLNLNLPVLLSVFLSFCINIS